MLTVTLHYSPAIIRRSVFAYLRRGFGTVSLVGLAVVGVYASFLVVTDPGSWLTGAIFGAVAVLSSLLIGLYLIHYRQGMAKLARMHHHFAVLQLTESALIVSSQTVSSTIQWSTFTGLWRFNDFWLLIIGNGQFMTLPLADLTEEAQVFIASHINAHRVPSA